MGRVIDKNRTVTIEYFFIRQKVRLLIIAKNCTSSFSFHLIPGHLLEGQTKLLALPFSNISSLQSFKNSIPITGKGGHGNGFDSAAHEHPSVYFLDSTSNHITQFIYRPFINLDSSYLEPNRAIKIWLYQKDTNNHSNIINETPFVETKKHIF